MSLAFVYIVNWMRKNENPFGKDLQMIFLVSSPIWQWKAESERTFTVFYMEGKLL